MSKYTTEVRFICESLYGLDESKGYSSVNEIISGVLDKIFDFGFPIFDENYRQVLEHKILKHFYTREIAYETYGLWKLKLDTKLNEIMPYYNKLYESELFEFNPLYTMNITETNNRTIDMTKKNTGTVTNGGYTETNRNGSNLNKYSDTPQGTLDNVVEGTYLTNASQDVASGYEKFEDKLSKTNDLTFKDDGTDNYVKTIVGYSGSIPSELIKKFRETLLNIDMLIINDLEELFFQLW